MATERIISPGVFTNESDLSFLPVGIAQIGAAFIGPTLKGPAGVPMQVTSYQDYQVMFGGEDSSQTYIPYAVKNYLKNATSALVVRILGDGGWSFTTTTNKLAAVVLASTGSTLTYQIISGLHPAKNNSDTNFDLRASTAANGNISNSFTLTASGSNLTAKNYNVSINRQNTDFISKVIGSSPESTKVSTTSYNDGIYSYVTFENFSTNLANSYGITLPGTSTISLGNQIAPFETALSFTSSIGAGYQGSAAYSSSSLAEQRLISSMTGIEVRIPSSSVKAAMPIQSFNLLTGSPQYLNFGFGSVTMPYIFADGFDYFSKFTSYSTSSNTFTMLVNYTTLTSNWNNPNLYSINTNVWPYTGSLNVTNIIYPVISGSSTPSTFIPAVTVVTSSYNVYFPDYAHAETPWITSGVTSGVNGVRNTQNLFKVHHLSDGNYTNTDIKISITNLREYSSGSYSTFDVLVRSYGDSDNRPSILEQYRAVNLDPNSPQYIARIIGDKYKVFDTTTNKIVEYGNYDNLSKYIRVEMDPSVDSAAVSETLSPRGFRRLKQTFIGFPNASMPPSSYVSSQNSSNNSYSSNKFLGWDFAAADNINYLKAIPVTGSATGPAIDSINPDYNVDNFVMPLNSGFTYTGSLAARVDVTGVAGPTSANVQFTVPFQGGSDGMSPVKRKLSGGDITATNSFGFDLSTATATGSVKYTDALDIISNQDEYDINGIYAPGVIRRLHPYVADYMVSTAEDRQDAFTIVDVSAKDDNIASVINEVGDMDSNYAATYYPWMQVLDSSINKPIWVPPSVLMPGVLAYNDSVAAEWYAPAGLNRGGISDALNVTTKLNHSERDSLYESSINPIASFPGQGIVAWGQKTLQQKPSSLDRINVRRLLIAVKKYIASTSRYLVFEQNTAATRNRFLSIVNPYLESIQQRQGLYAFKVVMDETNNTPSVIDRNLLVGDIYLQPSKTAEFIVINFNLTPTGAEFPA